MGHARALVGKKPEELDEKLLSQINIGKASVRDIENNYSKKKTNEPNLIQEEINLSQTIGFKTKITYSKSGKGNIKIFYNNLEQYSSDQSLVDEKNHILDIRKSIFENKKNNFNIKKLYLNIKKEAEYKKLSFLTY